MVPPGEIFLRNIHWCKSGAVREDVNKQTGSSWRGGAQIERVIEGMGGTLEEKIKSKNDLFFELSTIMLVDEESGLIEVK